MPKFAANLSMLWPDLDVYDRFRAAAEAGFSRVEILFVHALDTQRIKQQLQEHGLELVLFDPEPGDWEGGERGIAWDPRRRGEFQRTIHAALETARLLGVHRLNVLTGSPPADVSLANVHAALVESFAWAAPLAESAGVDLLVENINTTDFPGYYVSSVQRAAQLVQDVNRSNVRVQLDQYHVGMVGGDARADLRTYLDLVSHVQIADVPGRHEPGTGQQPVREFLADLDALGYQGAVGLEYRPAGATDVGLEWLPRTERG
jgi:hydroxypyruvate isomerase